MATMSQQSVKKRFETHPITFKVKGRVAEHVTGGFKYVEKAEEGGYMVHFPQGHSIRVRNDAELKRLGFHKQPGLVDMASGDVIADDQDETSLREMNDRRMRRKTVDVIPALDDEGEVK